MSLIILEGCDGSGKTTLAKKLMDFYGCGEPDNHGPYHGEAEITSHYELSIYRATLRPNQPARHHLMDRSWLSEPIYGAAMRGGVNRISAEDAYVLDMKAGVVNGVVILCQPPLSICLTSWRGRRESEYPDGEAKIEQIYELYKSSWHTWRLPTIVYDWTNDGFIDLVLELHKVRKLV